MFPLKPNKTVQPVVYPEDPHALSRATMDIWPINAGNLGRNGALYATLIESMAIDHYGQNFSELHNSRIRKDLLQRFKLGERAHMATTKQFTAWSFDPTTDVVGYIFSRKTGALSNELLSDLWKRAETQSPSQIYQEAILPLSPGKIVVDDFPNNPHLKQLSSGDRRFHFAYYDQYQEQGESAGFLLWIRIRKDFQHHGNSQYLLHETLSEYRNDGLKYAFAFARAIDMHKHFPTPQDAENNLQEYITRRDEKGLHPDQSIRFHQRAGARIICGIPNCSQDPESMFQGVLVMYSLSDK